MKEIWKPINGFENKYEVSNLGRVRGKDRYAKGKGGCIRQWKGKILKPQIASGYAQVYLTIDGKQKWYKIHRLVAQAFLPNPNNLPIINHKDCDTLNNVVTNLEWCDAKYNTVYALIAKQRLDVSVEEYIEQLPLKKKECSKAYSKQYYKNNKERYRQYYLKNKEKILQKYHEKRKQNYLY